MTADKLSRMTPVINTSYTKAIDVLRVQAVTFFIIDSEGKAEIEGLNTGTYYVCGVGETSRKSGVWNVRVELKPGKNSLYPAVNGWAIIKCSQANIRSKHKRKN